jgi:hypothetical protein
MLAGKTVFAAEIPATILAVEWQVLPLPAEGTVLMNRDFFLPENIRKKRCNASENSHRFVLFLPG